MKNIHVRGATPYDIKIQSGAIRNCGDLIAAVKPACSALIISDSNVAPLYSGIAEQSLKANGFRVSQHIFPAGESNKKLSTVEDMLRAMCESKLTRSDLVVALGGGVTGDMAGFASSIYLRGIDFVQIPTTLLAQIDSSVGGKTGCDLEFGKNLVGAFHNPRLVVIDPDTLKTLPERFMRDGMGEAVKYGCIFDEALFRRFETENYRNFLPGLIEECVIMKRDVVEEDFTEHGRRTLLNFGHTIAHAIEKEQNYCGMSHGEAVAAGMVIITRAAEKCNLCEPGTADRISALLSKLNLPTGCDIEYSRLSETALHDKKAHGEMIKLVLINKIGSSFTHDIQACKLTEFLNGQPQ